MMAFLTVSFIYTDPLYLAVIATIAIIILLIANIPPSLLIRLFRNLAFIMIFIVIFSSMGFDAHHFRNTWAQQIFAEVLGIRFTLGGILMGLTLVLRLITIVISTSLVSTTTRIEDFVAFARKLRLPYGLILAFIIAIRFIPMFMNKLNDMVNGLKARGIELDRGSFAQKLWKRYLVMSSMIIIGIKKSEELGIALQVRCFGASRNVTILYETKMSFIDYIMIKAIIAIVIISIYLRIIGYGVL